jgi:hypothetical protein
MDRERFEEGQRPPVPFAMTTENHQDTRNISIQIGPFA